MEIPEMYNALAQAQFAYNTAEVMEILEANEEHIQKISKMHNELA